MNYTETLKLFKEYYANTLIVQYHGKQKATETIKLLVELIFSNMLLMQIRDAFCLEDAQIFTQNYLTDNGEANIKHVVINKFTFQKCRDINNVGGYYTFYYDGSDWLFKGEVVSLSDYGIRYSDAAIEGDTIIINYTPYTARKEQLDIIGKWVGVTSQFNINLITSPKLSYPQYSRLFPTDATSDLQGGYSDYYVFDDNYITDNPPTDAYIVGNTDYAADWLSLTDGGASITPQNGEVYKVKTDGLYYDKIFVFTGELEDENNNIIRQGHYELYQSVGGQLRYNDMQSIENSIEEPIFRQILGLKIIYNSINHTQGEIDDAIYKFWGGDVITKWTDNTIIYEYSAQYSQIMQIANYKGVLPAPIGATIQLTQIGE